MTNKKGRVWESPLQGLSGVPATLLRVTQTAQAGPHLRGQSPLPTSSAGLPSAELWGGAGSRDRKVPSSDTWDFSVSLSMPGGPGGCEDPCPAPSQQHPHRAPPPPLQASSPPHFRAAVPDPPMPPPLTAPLPEPTPRREVRAPLSQCPSGLQRLCPPHPATAIPTDSVSYALC